MTQKLEWKIAAALRHTGHVTVDQAGECAEAVMAMMIAAQSEPATRAVPVAMPHNDWTHELKTDSEVFDAVARGDKTHEIRRNDRNFLVGDTLILRETRYTGQEMSGPEPRPLVYTGRTETRVVSHVLEGYGLQPGWAILSFAAPTPDAERHVANHAGDFHAALVLEMSELCDRNSPEDEPDAMVANSGEMAGCIERALERTGLQLSAAPVQPTKVDQ